MRLVRIMAHPYTVIASFFIILINGEGFGGFFLLYLLLGLPYGAVHSIVALISIILLTLAVHRFKDRKNGVTKYLMEILGVLLLILSLFLFFYNDKTHYNYSTFSELVSVITLVLFTIISITSIATNVFLLYQITRGKSFPT